jgi:hypothetical protein
MIFVETNLLSPIFACATSCSSLTGAWSAPTPTLLQKPSLSSAGGTRQSQLSTRQRSLGKDFIGKNFFAECQKSTLGKVFAECQARTR